MTFIARLGAYTVASFAAFLVAIFSGVALTFATDNIKNAGEKPTTCGSIRSASLWGWLCGPQFGSSYA